MKTNACRQLDQAAIPYETGAYAVDEDDLSAETVARKIGWDPAHVFKTLAARGDKTGVMLALVATPQALDLKALASASGNKKVELLALKDVLPTTGYVRGGVSPLGAKKRFPVYLDESARACPRISISAGMRGLQIFIAPDDLVAVTGATWARLGS